MFEPLFYMKFR